MRYDGAPKPVIDKQSKKEKPMNFVLKTLAATLIAVPLLAHAGGDPEHVKFPQGYEKTFTQYQ